MTYTHSTAKQEIKERFDFGLITFEEAVALLSFKYDYTVTKAQVMVNEWSN